MELLLLEKLDFFHDESDGDGYRSGGPGTCTFPFYLGKSVGSASGVGSVVFVSTGIASIGDILPLVLFLPRGVYSKVG